MEEGNENGNEKKKFYNALFQDMQAASNAYSKILILYDKFRFTPKKDFNAFFNASTLFINELNKNISSILQFLNDGYNISGDDNLYNIIYLISKKTRVMNNKYLILKEGYFELNNTNTQNNKTNLEQKINILYKISIVYKISDIAYEIMQLIRKGLKFNGQIMANLLNEEKIDKIINNIIDADKNKDNNENTTS